MKNEMRKLFSCPQFIFIQNSAEWKFMWRDLIEKRWKKFFLFLPEKFKWPKNSWIPKWDKRNFFFFRICISDVEIWIELWMNWNAKKKKWKEKLLLTSMWMIKASFTWKFSNHIKESEKNVSFNPVKNYEKIVQSKEDIHTQKAFHQFSTQSQSKWNVRF